jgi:hypothetical protein
MTAQEKETYLRDKARREEAPPEPPAEEPRPEDRGGRGGSSGLTDLRRRQGRAALEQVKALIQRQDLERAHDLAARAARDFADTPAAEELSWLANTTARDLANLRETQRIEREKWQRHCQEAMLLLGDVKGLMARRNFDGALVACRAGLKDYGDTPSAPEFGKVLRQAEQEQAAARAAQDEAARKRLQAGLDCLRQVQGLVASGEFAKAVALGQQGLKDYADTPSAERIAEAMDDARKKLAVLQADRDRRAKHEQDANEALALVRALLERKDWAKALLAARAAAKDYADTGVSKDLTAALAAIQRAVAAEEDQKQRHERFLRFRQEGTQAMARRNYAAAAAAFQNALREEEDASTRQLLAEAQRLARPTPSPTPTASPSPSPTPTPATRPAEPPTRPRPRGAASPTPSPSP